MTTTSTYGQLTPVLGAAGKGAAAVAATPVTATDPPTRRARRHAHPLLDALQPDPAVPGAGDAGRKAAACA